MYHVSLQSRLGRRVTLLSESMCSKLLNSSYVVHIVSLDYQYLTDCALNVFWFTRTCMNLCMLRNIIPDIQPSPSFSPIKCDSRVLADITFCPLSFDYTDYVIHFNKISVLTKHNGSCEEFNHLG